MPIDSSGTLWQPVDHDSSCRSSLLSLIRKRRNISSDIPLTVQSSDTSTGTLHLYYKLWTASLPPVDVMGRFAQGWISLQMLVATVHLIRRLHRRFIDQSDSQTTFRRDVDLERNGRKQEAWGDRREWIINSWFIIRPASGGDTGRWI